MSTNAYTTGGAGDRPRQVDVAAVILDYWWERRWFIIKVMTVAVLVFAGVLLLVPRRYKAQATVIVLPPRFLPEVRTQPLTVSTVRTLLESGGLLHQVIDRLRTARTLLAAKVGEEPTNSDLQGLAGGSPEQIAQRLGTPDEELATWLSSLSAGELRGILSFEPDDLADMTVDDLARLLSSEETVEKKTASDLTFSPLVQLYAISRTGLQAQVLANTWAYLFERMYDQLTRQKTGQQYRSIVNQQHLSQVELEDIQTTIVRYKAIHNLELLQRQIEENSEDFRNFSQQLVVKEAGLDRLRGRLYRLQTVVQAMEHEGEWIGRAQTLDSSGTATALFERVKRPLADDAEDLSSTLGAIADTSTSVSVGELYWRIRDETVRSAERLTSAIQESNQFYERQPLELMERMREQVQKDYLEATSRFRIGSVRLEALRGTLQQLDEQLSSTQQYLTLSTAVPQESVGTAIATGSGRQQLANLANVQFQRQEINPVWQTVSERRAIMSQEFELLLAEQAQLKAKLPAMDTELNGMQNTLYQARQAETFIKENLERWRANNEQLFRNYVELTNELSSTAQDIALLEQEVRALRDSAEASRGRVEQFQRQFDEASATLQVLELRQRAIQRNADLLLQKMQEAQNARDEEVSDVSIASRAVAPERHYFPQRSVMLLAATLLTGALLLGLLARQRFMELQAG